VVRSIELDDEVAFELDDPAAAPRRDWSDYPRGVAVELRRRGQPLAGANLLLTSEVPLGAGLSSSAALEVGVGLALLACAGGSIDRLALAQACRAAESGFAGTRCGIMDQFASCFGEAGAALLLDCRSLESQRVELPPGVALVVLNSMVKHELASGEYNRRREDCEAALRLLQAELPLASLRDLTVATLETQRGRLPERLYRRCRHVASENRRVLDFAAGLAACDLSRLGPLLAGSHASLRDDYEVSCGELDLLVELAGKEPGSLGARMTGGGFGGCTINLVREAEAAGFSARVAEAYRERTGIEPQALVCAAASGAAEVPLTG
jgi:galactokinase